MGSLLVGKLSTFVWFINDCCLCVCLGHVHNQVCEENQSGGHWKVNENGPADITNEVKKKTKQNKKNKTFSQT